MDDQLQLALIDLGIGKREIYRNFTQQVTKYCGWDYEEIKGSTSLTQRFLGGNWADQEFQIVQTYDDQIIGIESTGGNSA